MEIYETHFKGGPADGRIHRLTINEPTLEVWAHRQAIGVVEIGDGRYGGHQESLWEKHLYRRVDDALVTWRPTYVLAEWPACLEQVGGPSEPVSGCSDPEHDHFWYPENWPGGRAPGRWKLRTPERNWTRVSIWVPTPNGESDLWSQASFGGGDVPGWALRDIQGLIRAEKELAAEADAYITEQEELEEVRATGMAMPG